MKFHRLIDGSYWEEIDYVFEEYFSKLIVLKEYETHVYKLSWDVCKNEVLGQCLDYYISKHKNLPFTGISYHLNNTFLTQKAEVIESFKKNDFKDIEKFLKEKNEILGPEKESQYIELSNHMRNVNTLWNHSVIELSNFSIKYRI